jgi:hypothetical protein
MSMKWDELSIEQQIETLKKTLETVIQNVHSHIHSPDGTVYVLGTPYIDLDYNVEV